MNSLFLYFNEGIRNIPGNKFNPSGYINDRPKEINVSFKRCI